MRLAARTVPVIGPWLLPALLCSGCDSTPASSVGRPGGPHPTTSVAPLPVTQPASGPSTRAAVESPDYVSVVDRYRPSAPASVRAATERGNRLVIETRNVKRLRIERSKAPLDPDRSIALELDGQGIEWLRYSQVTEFERSTNGDWKPVRP